MMIEKDIILPPIWIRIITFGFRLLYNELAWSYDAVSWIVSMGQWRQWQRAAMPFLSGQSILELAHGPGHMLLELESNGYDVIGLDLSPFMTRMASRKLQQNESAAAILRAQAQRLPFVDTMFDSILSTFPTIFIVDPATLAELYRVIRPGGRVVIIPQARLTGGGILRRFVEWLYAITGQRPVPEEEQLDSPNWIMAEELFSSAGFNLNIEHVNLEKSIVTIIVATKA
jgi:ubiquinone/menaquinone biosynthesis C-methylase UbiE